MKKRLFTVMAVAMLAILLPLTSAYAVSTFLAETETRLYKPDKSYNGYFMPAAGSGTGGTHYLMDLWGNVVYTIEAKGGVPKIAPDGTIWSIGQIQDWDGNVLWSFTLQDAVAKGYKGGSFTMHHDQQRIWNKQLKQYTHLFVCNRDAITQAEAVAAGGDPNVQYGTRLERYDFIIEVNMNKEVIWEWNPLDHTCQNKNPNWARYVPDVKDAPGKFDVHWMTDNQRPKGTAGFTRDWLHVNSMDYNEELDQVVINPKHFSQFVVVDHGKTFVSTTNWAANIAAAASPDGDVIYRWGNPAMYNSGEAPGWLSEGDSQGYGFHNIQWIRPFHWDRPHLATDKWPDPATYTKSGVTLPGAGNFLIFDNGCYNSTRTGSRVLEINGRIGASGTVEVPEGKYVDPVVAGYNAVTGNYQRKISKQRVWGFQSSGMQSFYSSHISGCQRLPNGNTSINSGNQGLMFEVTPNGEVVWEYIYPGLAGPAVKFVTSDSNNVWQKNSDQYRGGTQQYRHYRYGADHPAFIGKALTPMGTLTGRNPRLVGEAYTSPTPVIYTGFGFGATGVVGGGGGAAGGAGSGGGTGY